MGLNSQPRGIGAMLQPIATRFMCKSNTGSNLPVKEMMKWIFYWKVLHRHHCNSINCIRNYDDHCHVGADVVKTITSRYFNFLGIQGQANNSASTGDLFGRSKIRSRILQKDHGPDVRRDQGASQKALLSSLQNRLSRNGGRFSPTGRERCEPVCMELSGWSFCRVRI